MFDARYKKCTGTLDYRTGPCYSGVRGALCVNQLEGVVCTKTLCCATVGKAWGHPCEHCPSRLECETGYLKNQKTRECVGKFLEEESVPSTFKSVKVLFFVTSRILN